MEHPGDKKLLDRYASEKSQAAFACLVKRHIGLVYSTCYRELGQRELAEEATQAVFIALAGKAKSIYSEAALAPWLYSTARRQASHIRQQEGRRMARENRAAEEALRLSERQEDKTWGSIEPALNDAISALCLSDRQAILLRFFDGMTLREVGQAMGTNEDAARMRVNRALEKLRGSLVNRKTATISVGVLAGLLTTHAAYAVPAYLPALVVQSVGAANLASFPPSPSVRSAGVRTIPLNVLLAKELLVMSITKIVAWALAVAVLAGLAVIAYFVIHRAHSAPVSYMTWQNRPAAVPATRQAEQRIMDQTLRYEDGVQNGNVKEVAATLSPSFVITFPEGIGGQQWPPMHKVGFLKLMGQGPGGKPHAYRYVHMIVVSCVVNGDKATIDVKVPGRGGQGGPSELAFVNTGGQWMITRF